MIAWIKDRNAAYKKRAAKELRKEKLQERSSWRRIHGNRPQPKPRKISYQK